MGKETSAKVASIAGRYLDFQMHELLGMTDEQRDSFAADVRSMAGSAAVQRQIEQPANSPWLVWSHEHNAFWRPERAGYTKLIEQAGRYSKAEAEAICRDARGGEAVMQTDLGEVPPEICFPAPEADLAKRIEFVIKPDLSEVQTALDSAVAGVNVEIANAAANLLDRCDQHAREIAEPIFTEEREALRAVLDGGE